MDKKKVAKIATFFVELQDFIIIQNSNTPDVIIFTTAMFFTENGYRKILIQP